MDAVCADVPEIIEALRSLNINYYIIRRDMRLPGPVSAHPDMMCYSCDASSGLTYDTVLIEKLSTLGKKYRQPSETPGNKYPYDIPLNCLRLGNKLISNTKYCSKDILADAENKGLDIIHVSQGYARCSVLAVTENAVITADTGIADILSRSRVDVLKISPGAIDLPGYNYGFIGGASAKIGNKIIFFGDPQSHPDGEKMLGFISAHGCESIFTGAHGLIDYGSCVVV